MPGSRRPPRPARPAASAAILEVVDNQVRDGKPAATGQTLERLIAAGYTREYARRLIGMVLLVEMNDMLAQHRTFDEDGFTRALQRLPNFP